MIMTIKKQLKKESKILISSELKQKTMQQFKLPKQEKRPYIIPFTVMLASVLLLFLVLFIPRKPGVQYLVIEINPALLVTYENKTVQAVTPLNEDAVVLLYDLESLEDQPLDVALKKIASKARLDGYIKPLTINHLGKDNLNLDYEITYNQRIYYQQQLKQRGYQRKQINVSNDELVKLMFNTNQDRLALLEHTLQLQTSKIKQLIHSNQQKAEAVLDSLKDVSKTLSIEAYQQIIETHFQGEPLYTETSLIKDQLQTLIVGYEEYVLFNNLAIETQFSNQYRNMLSIVKEHDYDTHLVETYDYNQEVETSITYDTYTSYQREDKVLLGLIDEMRALLKMPLRGKMSNERLDMLYTHYTELLNSNNISSELKTSEIIEEFEILYNTRGK